ncbi:MAG: hypothetical protein PHR28_06840 [candidate division Zixibacteria bacterium]|nr:hypothetical protein [candidate division Zixibacteria bacterium]
MKPSGSIRLGIGQWFVMLGEAKHLGSSWAETLRFAQGDRPALQSKNSRKKVLLCITKWPKTPKMTNRNHFPASQSAPYCTNEKIPLFALKSV